MCENCKKMSRYNGTTYYKMKQDTRRGINAQIDYEEETGEYVLYVGSVPMGVEFGYTIDNCPWCGRELKTR